MADTPVLGTGSERSESSNLSRPTKLMPRYANWQSGRPQKTVIVSRFDSEVRHQITSMYANWQSGLHLKEVSCVKLRVTN